MVRRLFGLSDAQRRYWEPVEAVVVSSGLASSLYAYVVREYEESERSTRDVAGELRAFGVKKVSHQGLLNLMRGLGVKVRVGSDALRNKSSQNKGKTFEEIYGERRARELKERLRSAFSGRTYEDRFGVERAREIRRKINARTRGKTYEELYGEERAREIKEKMSRALLGRKSPRKGKLDVEYFGARRAREIAKRISEGIRRKKRGK